ERCDGRDNDCDGESDEDFDGDGDGYASCAGDCDDGDREVSPRAPELCDGADNDCDGQTDERCACTPGATEACGSDTGACVAGTRRCDAGGRWGACDGEVRPVEEICDAADNDCDGQTDEGEVCGCGP